MRGEGLKLSVNEPHVPACVRTHPLLLAAHHPTRWRAAQPWAAVFWGHAATPRSGAVEALWGATPLPRGTRLEGRRLSHPSLSVSAANPSARRPLHSNCPLHVQYTLHYMYIHRALHVQYTLRLACVLTCQFPKRICGPLFSHLAALPVNCSGNARVQLAGNGRLACRPAWARAARGCDPAQPRPADARGGCGLTGAGGVRGVEAT